MKSAWCCWSHRGESEHNTYFNIKVQKNLYVSNVRYQRVCHLHILSQSGHIWSQGTRYITEKYCKYDFTVSREGNTGQGQVSQSMFVETKVY